VRLLSSKVAGYIARMPSVWVEGQVVEITRRGGSSTCFLTLRDTAVDMSLSMTVSARVLDATLSPVVEGARVVVRATPDYWEKRGRLSFQVHDVRPVGVGELLAQVEHLRRLLASEGLFALDRKRPLPFAPAVVGLVCGRDSAAEHDVVVNSRARWPATRFEVRRVAVQGGSAVTQVAEALAELDSRPEVEVVVVARGGGSLEDLLPFSNEALVRAVAACRTPVVSAIGHEEDAPLLDLVADVRASTPTDAARRIVPDVRHELAAVHAARGRLRRNVTGRLDVEQHRLDALRGRPVLADPDGLLDALGRQLDDARRRADRAVLTRLDRAADQVAHLRTQVRGLSPLATLERGYAVVQDADGHVLRDPADVGPGDTLRVRLARGDLHATAADDDALQ
jgi:exodeoxyribonuclease VII large subunit